MEEQQAQQQPVAADAGLGGSGSPPQQLLLPQSFVMDPAEFLVGIASQPPSRQGFAQLAGPVAAWFIAASPASEQVANVYLQAAAVQLREPDNTSVAASLGGRVAVGDAEHEEMLRTQQEFEILEAVSVAATQCVSRRMTITSSGILPTLAHIIISTNNPNQLQHASADFLHCAVLAEQYRYAARIVEGTWPRPNSTVSVKQVLRYYYLRGMIHIGCNDFAKAHQCFWTCLSIPAEACSQIMMEAWKKLILVQCVMTNEYEADTNTANKKPRLPKNMPNCMYRRLVNIRKEDAATTGEDFQPNFAGTKRSARSPQRTTTQQRQQRQTQPQLEQPGSIQSAACYMDISDAFYERDKAKLEELQTEYHDILAADGNVGLVQQCHTQLVRNQVAHLSKMYSVVPLKKLAELLKIPDDQVTKILCQSAVLCEVQADGMVVFADPRANEKPRSTVDIMEWMHLLDKVQELDIGIATTARYHSLVRKESSNSGDTKAVVAGPRGVEDF